jgi:hypothetical protein
MKDPCEATLRAADTGAALTRNCGELLLLAGNNVPVALADLTGRILTVSSAGHLTILADGLGI